jgi:eukaryotic-like serine/threonine-protein kinase
MTLFGVGIGEDSATAATSGPPKSLFGYDVIGQIGEGAGSLIYAVSDPATKHLYALKHVVRRNDKDIRFVEQLEAEHEVGKQVRHPGLRKTFDLKINKNLLFKVQDAALVMELFDGRSMEWHKPGSIHALVDVFIQTAKALDALHLMGYVHCDLKPNNILIDDKLRVKVIDLGQTTKTGTVKSRIQGTPDFIAPEQVKCKAVSFRTDVYNLGATMYWALAGQKMPTLYTVGKKENSFLLHDRIPTPASINKLVPEGLSNLVMECVKTDPLKRPRGMADIVSRLEIIHHALTRGTATPPDRADVA